MYRTHTCGELRVTHINQQVTLAGWVKTIRKFGSITFIELRDRYDMINLYFNEQINTILKANPLGREFVLQIKGAVRARSNKKNQITTGDSKI